MKSILLKFGIILSYIYPQKVSLKFSFIKSYIYTGWMSRSFKEMEGFLNYSICVTGGQFIKIGKDIIIGKGSILQAWSSY